jgi:uncharacterized protein YbaR (Trm112 family)
MSPGEYVGLLSCPQCGGELSARAEERDVTCGTCGRRFPVTDGGILELVDPEELDAETRRELEGNTYGDPRGKDLASVLYENEIIWDSYYWANRRLSIERFVDYLSEVDCDRLFLLASGTGRDVLFLQRYLPLKKVYCSDLSLSALQLLRERLDGPGLEVGLFTSNLDECPVRALEVPLLVVGALHHTRDMHAALQRLLAKGHRHLFIVEPASNAFMRFLAERGMARRVEYSGVKPGRLELPRVRELARRYGYRLKVTTLWNFPVDYYRRLFPGWRWMRAGFFALLRGFSGISNAVKLGNRAVIHLERVGRGKLGG